MAGNHDDPDRERKRHDAALGALLALYEATGRMLALMPVPITIPSTSSEDWMPGPASQAVHQAVRLIGDEPVPETIQALARWILLDWLTAYDLAARWVQDLSPWRTEVLEQALSRTATGLKLMERKLRE